MSGTDDQAGRMRLQRNRAACGAVLALGLTLSVVLPRSLHRDREERAAADRLLALQASVLRIQQLARDEQAEVIWTQNEIRRLVRSAK
jgi:hypothetical protein